MSVLSVDQVGKTYQSGSRQVPVLHDVSFSLAEGATAAVVGPSGSGKTTLLCLCAGLDPCDQGKITLLGQDLAAMDEEARARLRNQHVGFVFQSFHLMPSLTALENVMLPAELRGASNITQEARRLLDLVGLNHRETHYPAQLSGGEQQRVAIARAFINQPKILFADEPTGNLDGETSERITRLLFDMNRERGATLLLITHDESLAARTDMILRLERGRLAATETAHVA